MDSTWLVLLSLALGLVIGAGFAAVLQFAARHGEHVAGMASTAVPDGVDQVLDVLESAGMVLDPSSNLVKASPGALALGLVSNDALVHPELTRLVERVRRTGAPATDDVELARGPFGDANIQLRLRAADSGCATFCCLPKTTRSRTDSRSCGAISSPISATS